MKRIFLAILIVLLFSSCFNSAKNRELKISTNSWIGYAPLFYANEMGYLKKLNIKLITNVSLAEAADVFNIGRADMVTTTQHEYYSLKSSMTDIVPIVTMDKSYGGDMILSNRNISTLKKTDKIYAYLEIDSINLELLRSFIKNNSLDAKKIEFINMDQAQIQDVENDENRAIVIVTYCPYGVSLKQKGFKEIASTKNSGELIVIDTLCGTKSLCKSEKRRLVKLKHIIDLSIEEMQKNEKKSYELVYPYLNNIDFKEYLASLKIIKWINHPSEKLLLDMKKLGYETEYLIK